MSTKAEKTAAFIIETIAPIFNSQGYVGTSMSDLTKATKLTKGALYGNFENKESLALAAFDYNSVILITALDKEIALSNNPLEKLYLITGFYKKYHLFTKNMGGCPILNTGVDAQNINRKLAGVCKQLVKDIELKIAAILEEGSKEGILMLPVSSLQFAKQFFTMIQGAVAMASITQDYKYLVNTMTYLDILIKNELVRK